MFILAGPGKRGPPGPIGPILGPIGPPGKANGSPGAGEGWPDEPRWGDGKGPLGEVGEGAPGMRRPMYE